MTGYYAFNHRRYRNAISPLTPAVVFEAGFLSNRVDATLLLRRPETVARGLADGVLRFVRLLA